MKPKTPQESFTVISQFMLPSDANHQGNVHGGTIMKLADTAGGIAASRHGQRPVVTVVIDTMTFLSPVYIGQLLTLTATPIYVGRTSIDVIVEVIAESVLTGEKTHTNTAHLTFVALDENRRPTPVPPLIATTDIERRRMEEAASRRNDTRSRRQPIQDLI